MRILFLTTDLSYPPQDGRMLRTYNVLSGLARRHQLHLVCYDQRHGADPESRRRQAEQHLRSLCLSVDTYEIPARRSPFAMARTASPSLLSNLPFSSQAYRSPDALRRIDALAAAHPFDVIHVENTLLA